MAQPMINVKLEAASVETPKAMPHLLPCRVHHSGPVEPVQSFWEPKPGDDGTSTAYFRGRKLQGRTVKLPEGFRGVVAAVSVPEGASRHPEVAEIVDLEAEEPQGMLQADAEFDQMVVWSHEVAVDAAADPYMRGTEEWIALAGKIHSYSAPSATK